MPRAIPQIGQLPGASRTICGCIGLGADVRGMADDANTIRIGTPYNAAANPPAGQSRTFVAGIVNNALSSGTVVSVYQKQ